MSTTHAPDRTLPDPVAEPTISVARTAAILGISTRAGYVACERGDIPCVQVGRSWRVYTAAFLAKYPQLTAAA